jgi:hypothetical protein
MTASGFAIAELIVFILVLFLSSPSVIFCRSDRPRPIDAG